MSEQKKQNMVVMLVDQSAEKRRIFAQLLRQVGFDYCNIVKVSSSHEALEFLEDQSVDMIFADCAIGMSVLDLARLRSTGIFCFLFTSVETSDMVSNVFGKAPMFSLNIKNPSCLYDIFRAFFGLISFCTMGLNSDYKLVEFFKSTIEWFHEVKDTNLEV